MGFFTHLLSVAIPSQSPQKNLFKICALDFKGWNAPSRTPDLGHFLNYNSFGFFFFFKQVVKDYSLQVSELPVKVLSSAFLVWSSIVCSFTL